MYCQLMILKDKSLLKGALSCIFLLPTEMYVATPMAL